jgi:hypothetical protein
VNRLVSSRAQTVWAKTGRTGPVTSGVCGATQPRSVMNSRRLMSAPMPRMKSSGRAASN